MRFECKGENFSNVIQQVSRARSKTQSQNYLQDVFLNLEDHILTLRATNLEITCEKSFSVKGIQNGSCILKGDTLVKIIPLLKRENTVFFCELIDGVFSIKTEKDIVEIKTTPYEDFPTLPPQGELIGSISILSLSTLLREVSFCSATTEIKPEISSIFIYSKEKDLISVATDSYRLAEKVVNNENNLNISVLIPQKYVVDILSILNDEEGEISIYKKDGLLTLSNSNLNLCIHIITGNFPDYRQLFPKEFSTTCLIDKEELQKSLTLTTYFTEQYSQVKCIVNDNNVTLSSKNENIGQVINTIKTEKEGADIEVNYNNKYFLDVFSHINGNKIKLSFTTANKPVFMEGNNDISFTYLLMPLNR